MTECISIFVIICLILLVSTILLLMSGPLAFWYSLWYFENIGPLLPKTRDEENDNPTKKTTPR